MNTLTEVKKAVKKLNAKEKVELTGWLNSQLAPPSMTANEEKRLLTSLDEAMRDLDAGKGVPIEEVRKLIPSWVSRSSSHRRP